MAKSKVTDTDKGAKAMLKRMAKKIPAVRVGIYGDAAAATHKDASAGATVGEIAAAHEFGSGVPERPWLSGTVVKNKERIETGLRKVADAVKTGSVDPAVAMRQLGQGIAGLAKEAISDGIAPPLSPQYLARKLKKYPGAAKPLIASGQMRSAIASDLEK